MENQYTALSLQHLTSGGEGQGSVAAVLRRAGWARTDSGDLLGDNGYENLRKDISSDFPYLTLTELSDIISLGIKGKLDKRNDRPLNYTRVYQWVEQRAPYCETYWAYHYPELWAWAGITGMQESFMANITAREPRNLPENFFIVASILRNTIPDKYWPYIYDGRYAPTAEGRAEEEANRVRFREELLPAFAEQYPEFYAKHRQHLHML